jgi:hypothetical protein
MKHWERDDGEHALPVQPSQPDDKVMVGKCELQEFHRCFGTYPVLHVIGQAAGDFIRRGGMSFAIKNWLTKELKMYLHTKKQKENFEDVIRLHYDKGYGAKRISRILPIGHSTVSKWLAIFSVENTGKSVQMRKTSGGDCPLEGSVSRRKVTCGFVR